MTTTQLPGRVDLSEHGIDRPPRRSIATRRPSLLYTHALKRGEGRLAEGGPLAVDTGRFTGRSPKDKFLVEESRSQDRIWWGDVNQPLSEQHFDGLRDKVTAQLGAADALYVVDAWAGADPAHRIGVRVITAHPYHALFAKHDVHRPRPRRGRVVHARGARAAHARPRGGARRRTGRAPARSSCCIPGRTELLVGGTFYAGEIKKSIFTVMNDRLPLEGVFPMHCSANVGADGRVAVFFGLSGTGKTTLSADPERSLIGDDEHGWGDNGVFNIEGGCYAKVIRLSAAAEPEIFRTTHTFGTILENVTIDENGVVDLDDDSKTENTRAAYKLEQIANALPSKHGGPPGVGHLPDRRRLRDPAADREADARAGALLLPLRLHRQARRHRDRRHRAAADVLDLLRPAVPAAAARRLRADARREARRARLGRLARQHRLDRRAVRRGQPHADRRDALDADRRALGRARRGRAAHRRGLRLPGAGRRPGRRREAARPALDVGRPRRLRRQGP